MEKGTKLDILSIRLDTGQLLFGFTDNEWLGEEIIKTMDIHNMASSFDKGKNIDGTGNLLSAHGLHRVRNQRYVLRATCYVFRLWRLWLLR